MTIIRDAVRAIKTMSGRWMYVDEHDLYVASLDYAADWPAWDGSALDEGGRIVEAAPRVAEVEPPPYEPTDDETAWLNTLEALQPWHYMSPEEVEADRLETLERLRREDEWEATSRPD